MSPDTVSKPPIKLRYTAFDGQIIYLEDSLDLVPNGWIRYPFEDGGKKQLFKLGEPQSEEIHYD